jgi:hypothetical protein
MPHLTFLWDIVLDFKFGKERSSSRDVDHFRAWGDCIDQTHRCLRISTPRVTPLSAMVKSKLKQKQTSFTVYPNQAMHHRRHHLRLSSSLLSCARTPPLLFKQPNIKLRTNIASSNKTKLACKTVYLSKRSSSIYPNLS